MTSTLGSARIANNGCGRGADKNRAAAGGRFSFLAVGRKPRSGLVEPVMLKHLWIEELADEARSAWVVLRSFWVRNVWPVLMTLCIFFVFAAPLIIVILILWYLDSIGWQSGPGFYTIGSAAGAGLVFSLIPS